MAGRFEAKWRWLAWMTLAAIGLSAIAWGLQYRTGIANAQEKRRIPASDSSVARAGLFAGQPPVRPRASLEREPDQSPTTPRVVKGQIRLDAVNQAFKEAVLVLTLERSAGMDLPAVKLAEVRYFNVYKDATNAQSFFPFTFGDFYPRTNAVYHLQCYLDLNANGVRDGGDFWNQRRVDVLGPNAPESVPLEDFVPVGGSQ